MLCDFEPSRIYDPGIRTNLGLELAPWVSGYLSKTTLHITVLVTQEDMNPPIRGVAWCVVRDRGRSSYLDSGQVEGTHNASLIEAYSC